MANKKNTLTTDILKDAEITSEPVAANTLVSDSITADELNCGVVKGVVLSEECAYTLLRLLEDIDNINDRSGCSDRYFRSHFTDAMKVVHISGALNELRKALDGKC